MPAEVALLGYAMPFARDTRYDSLLRLCPIIKMLRIFSLSLSVSLFLSLYRYRYRLSSLPARCISEVFDRKIRDSQFSTFFPGFVYYIISFYRRFDRRKSILDIWLKIVYFNN